MGLGGGPPTLDLGGVQNSDSLGRLSWGCGVGYKHRGIEQPLLQESGPVSASLGPARLRQSGPPSPRLALFLPSAASGAVIDVVIGARRHWAN